MLEFFVVHRDCNISVLQVVGEGLHDNTTARALRLLGRRTLRRGMRLVGFFFNCLNVLIIFGLLIEVEIAKFIERFRVAITHLFDILLEARALFFDLVALFGHFQENLIFLFDCIFDVLHTIFHLLKRILLFPQLQLQFFHLAFHISVLLHDLPCDFLIFDTLPVHFFFLLANLVEFIIILAHVAVDFVEFLFGILDGRLMPGQIPFRLFHVSGGLLMLAFQLQVLLPADFVNLCLLSLFFGLQLI